MVVGSFLQVTGCRPHGTFRLRAPDNARSRGRQASLCVRVSGSQDVPSTGGNRVVASVLLQKEEELKAITAPGRLPPRAAVVASLRKEIAALREQLKSSVSANLPPTLAADLPVPSSTSTLRTAGSSNASYTTRSPAMGATTSSPLPSGARSALLLVEQQLAVGSSSGAVSESERARLLMQAVEQNMALMSNNSIGAFGSDPEVQGLQQENALLQAQLETLVERRRHLQILKQKLASGTLLPAKESDTKEGGAKDSKPKKTRKSRVTSSSSKESSSKATSSSSDEEGLTSEGSSSESEGAAPKRRTRRPTTKAVGVDGEVKAPVKRRTAKKEGDASTSTTAAKRGRKPKAAAVGAVVVAEGNGVDGEIKNEPTSAVTVT